MSRFSPALGLTLLVICSLLLPALAYTVLSDNSLKKIPGAGLDFDIHDGALLAPILIPRVPDTPGSLKVQQHFVDFFTKTLPQWTIEWHNSTSLTPATGDKLVNFRNLIFRRDPPWAAVGDVGRLTLVAHYDSLYRPEGFIGATDSAAPCALLMHIARSVDEALSKRWEEMEAAGETGDGLEEEKGVQILLLDGEEAWVSWTDTDSIYGSRALAQHWESELHPAMSIHKSPLDSISLFVLLDLLGAENPHVPSYFKSTHWAYQHIASIEDRMRKLKLLETRPKTHFLTESGKLPTQFGRGFVSDDHIPFMARGVNILHIIPTPFPRTWHTMQDDGEHLHGPTLQDWGKIMTAFVAEWMDLEGHLPTPPKVKVHGEEKSEL